MATGGGSSPPQLRHPVTSQTDCPHCGSLCLGPTILPCGHLACRRCLHDMLQPLGPQAACQQCGQQLHLPRDQALTISQVVQQMGTDPVMEQLVLQELEKDPDIRCLNCPNKQAVNVCLDCQEYVCGPCSAIHQRSRLLQTHVLHLLPQSLQNAPTAARATPRPWSPSVLSTTSLDSIRNIDDPQTRDVSRGEPGGEKEWKEWVRKEVGLLQQASSEQLQVGCILQDVVSLGQKMLDRQHRHQQVQETYSQLLPRLDVIRRYDPSTYVIGVRGSDVSLDVKTTSLEKRLCDVRKCRQYLDVNAVDMMMTKLTQLLNYAEQDQRSDSTPVTSVRPSHTSSSTLTPTSTPLPSPTLTTTPTPTPRSIIPPPTTPTLTSALLSPPTSTTTPTFPPSVDVKQAKPSRLFSTLAATADDRKTPYITAMVCLPDGRLVMTDVNNNMVKVMEVSAPHTVTASLPVDETPLTLALLCDGHVAVTTRKPVIYLLTVTDTVTVASRIQTDRWYSGIAGHGVGHLIVGCGESSTAPAALDVLNRKGDLVSTIIDSTRLPGLTSPYFLFNAGDNQVLASDWDTHTVFNIDVSSGQVTLTHQHKDMRGPRQVCVDSAGQLYVASGGSKCVMVLDRAGQWRRLLTDRQHSDPGYVHPVGLCLTRSGHLVVSWVKPSSPHESVVICYRLT